MNIYYITK